MPDGPREEDDNEGSAVADGRRYEVQDLADAYGLTINQALDLIERYGHDRDTLDREARKLT